MTTAQKKPLPATELSSAQLPEKALATQLADVLLTQQDRWDFVASLDTAKQLLYLKSNTLETLLEQLPIPHAEILQQTWKLLVAHPSTEQLLEIIVLLEKTVARFPVVSLSLSYQPSRKQLRELVIFLRSKLDQSVLVETVLDRSLVAGVVVRLDGKSLDLSLRETIRHAKI